MDQASATMWWKVTARRCSPSDRRTRQARSGGPVRQPLPARSITGQEMFAIDDLARIFGFTTKDDPIAGGLTFSLLVGAWLTSAFWYATDTGFPGL